jgi:hypothetical protein
MLSNGEPLSGRSVRVCANSSAASPNIASKIAFLESK